MRTDATKINERSPYTDLTEGLQMFSAGTAKNFNTGEWRTNTPVMDWTKCRRGPRLSRGVPSIRNGAPSS